MQFASSITGRRQTAPNDTDYNVQNADDNQP